jgi:hypothetical protein
MVAAYDPFLLMQDEKKVYGFTLSLFEYIETIPTLWDTVKGEPIIRRQSIADSFRLHTRASRTHRQ